MKVVHLRRIDREAFELPFDSWIAASALANGFAVLMQDADYDSVPGLDVIKM